MSASNGEDRGSPPVGGDGPEGLESLLLYHVRRLGGDEPSRESFRYVFEVYYDRVRRFFLARGWAGEDARDLTQDTFIRVHQGRGTFATLDDFKAWLFRIARNVHFNAKRDRHAAKRNPYEESLEERLEEHGAEIADPAAGAEPGPLADFLERELRAVVAAALRELPPKMRRCYLLHLRHGWTYREIGEFLGIAEGTVKAHIFQARRRVAERVAAYREATRFRDRGEDEP